MLEEFKLFARVDNLVDKAVCSQHREIFNPSLQVVTEIRFFLKNRQL